MEDLYVSACCWACICLDDFFPGTVPMYGFWVLKAQLRKPERTLLPADCDSACKGTLEVDGRRLLDIRWICTCSCRTALPSRSPMPSHSHLCATQRPHERPGPWHRVSVCPFVCLHHAHIGMACQTCRATACCCCLTTWWCTTHVAEVVEQIIEMLPLACAFGQVLMLLDGKRRHRG